MWLRFTKNEFKFIEVAHNILCKKNRLHRVITFYCSFESMFCGYNFMKCFLYGPNVSSEIKNSRYEHIRNSLFYLGHIKRGVVLYLKYVQDYINIKYVVYV